MTAIASQLESRLMRLSGSLDDWEHDVRLVRVIARYPDKKLSRHHVLNFALEHATRDVHYLAVLRLSETLAPFLEEGHQALGLGSLFVGKGRKRRPKDDDLAILLRLRDHGIAHYIKMSPTSRAVWDDVLSTYRDISEFLLVVIARMKAIVADMEKAGLFARHGYMVTSRRTRVFTEDHLRHLIVAANGVAHLAPALD